MIWRTNTINTRIITTTTIAMEPPPYVYPQVVEALQAAMARRTMM